MLVRSSLTAVFAAAFVVHAAYGQHNHAQPDHARHEQADSQVTTQSAGDSQKSAATGPHGGSLQKVGSLQLEALIDHGGLRLFVYDAKGQPVDVSNARGLATLRIAGDAKRYRYDLFADTDANKTAKSLGIAVDLSRIAGRQVEIDFQLVGVPEAGRAPLRFRHAAMVPMAKQQLAAAAIAEQKVCPVSGEPLGSMGEPIAVEVGGKTVYVCCKGCIDAVKANPAKYVAGRQPLKVTPATKTDAAAIALQKVCPVMDEPLGSMGTPLKVTGLGRDVYLCCKGCLKFLEKEPEKYLAKLPPQRKSAKPEVAKATKLDAQFVAAQKTCPVMDEPLDAMGGPWKTVVSGRVVYLCCPGCAKKLHAEPQTYLEKLAGLGVTPPREQ